MHAFKWFFRVNLVDDSLIEYTLLPNAVGSCSDLLSRSESEISDLNWAGVGEGFLNRQAALNKGITEEQLIEAKNNSTLSATDINQSYALCLFENANHEDVNNAWESFSDIERSQIVNYRQALQNIEHEDIFNPVWPDSPAVLVNFYKNK